MGGLPVGSHVFSLDADCLPDISERRQQSEKKPHTMACRNCHQKKTRCEPLDDGSRKRCTRCGISCERRRWKETKSSMLRSSKGHDPKPLASTIHVYEGSSSFPNSLGYRGAIAPKEVSRCVECFFREIHPYIAILDPTAFLSQQGGKEPSSVLLTAIVACASLWRGNPTEGCLWINVVSGASRTLPAPSCLLLTLTGLEKEQQDNPSLETVQVMLLKIVAEELAADLDVNRTCSDSNLKAVVAVCVRLGLDKHKERHEQEGMCTDRLKCMQETQCWRRVLVVETLWMSEDGTPKPFSPHH